MYYERDIRLIVNHSPDEQKRDRLRAFKAGWTAGANGKRFSDQALSRTTWNNLGCEFGWALGQVEAEKKEKVFDILAALQVAKRTQEAEPLEEEPEEQTNP